MKFSKDWLAQHIDAELGTAELIARLTMAGLEVDGVEPAAPAFSGVVVGEITAVAPHPDADQLRVCQVTGSAGISHQVVCGAPNATVGLKAPFAQVGAQLPGDVAIAAARLRGVESQGMLCAAAELGLASDSAGLLALDPQLATGVDLRAALALDDEIIEVDFTPNRGDCLSIRGLAREAAVVLGGKLRGFPVAPVAAAIEDRLAIELHAPEACPRYAGRILRGLNPEARTPQWLQEQLRRAGIRAIHPVVDVTNYVMLELGQPMHGFDLTQLRGGIQVRFAKPGEVLVLLDGAEIALDAKTLVIADQQRPLALAGIMGGRDSGVSADTVDVFLESAHFDPLAIAGKARQFGLHTDSSHRFERGVDPELPLLALERATGLLLDIAGGMAGPAVLLEAPRSLAKPAEVQLRRRRLAQQLGLEIPAARVVEILASLGLEKVAESEDGWQFRIPSWRFDLSIEADLIEEVARVYGYNELPAGLPALAPELRAPEAGWLQTARAALVHRGYQEVISYSFVPPEMAALIATADSGVSVANPISAAMSVMRPSLWPGLLMAARHNLNRQQGRLRLFETGLRFSTAPGFGQQMTIAGLITGERDPQGWANARNKADFYGLKGDLEALLQAFGVASHLGIETGEHAALHPGQRLRLTDAAGNCLGHAGALSPLVERALEFGQPLYLFEIFVDRLQAPATPRFKAPSRFPAVGRDLAVVVAQRVAAADLLAVVRKAAGALLVDSRIFDVYHGEGLENNEKSIAISLTFQDDERTLKDTEVQGAEAAVIAALAAEFGARLRGE
ncbi:MAG TPA: phenylalanine--tRNA ligase subunit beta [Porticoccaceae bacterium]|nr:phenylalanine--tRNA ligase subunit beta [Porticoccaceae bacterium]